MLLHTLPTPIEYSHMTYRAVVESHYMTNGSLAVVLVSSDSSYSIPLSVNLVNESTDREAGEFFLNVNSDAADGFRELLVQLGVLEVTDELARSGYVMYPKCRLLRDGFARSEEISWGL